MTIDAPRVVAAIPARWGSTRFPGKALADLTGEPMIAHVVRRALAARTIDHVIVATDDERVAAAATAAGAEAVMTGVHPSGTDRIAEAVAGGSNWELVINVQGDEPMLSGANIDTLVEGMRARPEVGMATLCRPISAADVDDPNAVKVVRRTDGRALYFSRSVDPVSAGFGSCRVVVAASPRNLRLSTGNAGGVCGDGAVIAGTGRGIWNSFAPWRTASIFWFSTHRTRPMEWTHPRTSNASD